MWLLAEGRFLSDADEDFLSSSGLRVTLEQLCAEEFLSKTLTEKESERSDRFPPFTSVLCGFRPALGPDLQLG